MKYNSRNFAGRKGKRKVGEAGNRRVKTPIHRKIDETKNLKIEDYEKISCSCNSLHLSCTWC